MIDVVYFTTGKNFYDYQELRYSLRSLEKHGRGVGRVFVLGARARWWHNLHFIPEEDPYTHNKDANIIRKMHAACQQPEIGDPFLFVNDDHFFTRDFNAGLFPYFFKGRLLPNSPNREYSRRVDNTRRLLEERGLPVRNYDIHTPIIIWKRLFLEIFAGWDWVDPNGPGVVMKSVYGNSMPEIAAAGQHLTDCKMTARARGTVEGWLDILAGRPCFSVGNQVPRLVWKVLEELYPEPSGYEKDAP